MTPSDAHVIAPFFTATEYELLRSHADDLPLPDGHVLSLERHGADALLLLVEGRVRESAMSTNAREWKAGDSFGRWGASGQPCAALVSMGDARFWKLPAATLELIASSTPGLILKLFGAFLGELRVSANGEGDAAPSVDRVEVVARLSDGERKVRAGTLIRDLLPSHVDNNLVIAALMDRKCVSLNRTLGVSASLEPIGRKHLQGRAIYRESLGLMAIEAARRIDPGIKLQLGPSLGFAHIIEVEYGNGYSRGELARMLGEKMRAMVEEDVTYRRERWSVEEARALFRSQGWDSAVRLLRTWRHSTVPLVSCGEVYAVEFGPMVPSTGCFGAFDVVDNDSDLLLYFGDSERKSRDLVDAVHPGRMAREHQQWLRAVGIDSVGAFNDHCITGEVAQIIRISEGFHEKRLSQIADEIARRQPRIKVICVSGPSSSGKTTFLKRLAVQLQVNGLTPRSISLDNYYVDREFTVRDANGEYDFEAFEALDCKLLEAQLQTLVRGETVRLARYDFTTGKSIPSAGPDMHLGPNDVLLVEGIHALNPRLPISHDDGVFRIFINPVTSLPLDCVTRVSVSDIRLLRRIVRDRHSRAITARDNIARWPSVRRGERAHIFPFQGVADAVFNSSLIYEPAVLKVYAERYLLEVPESDEAYTTAYWLRRVIDKFVAIYPDRVPQTSLLREFIGGSSFEH